MCVHITAVVPSAADTAKFRELVDQHGLAFWPISNPHIVPQLQPGEVYCLATRAMCDCTSGLTERPPQIAYEKQVKKHRARGWSEAKIERWLKSKGPRPDAHHAEQTMALRARLDWGVTGHPPCERKEPS